MFKMQTNKSTGETCVLTVETGHRALFRDMHNAVEYVGLMKGLYYKRRRRAASEAYPVRALNPGKYPIRVRKVDLERRYRHGKL